jgi:ATP-dependent RNA helicase DDX19/DBP5
MMFFSATYEEDVMEFAEGIVSDPVIIRLRREEESLHNIKQYYVMCRSLDEKYTAIANIYGVVTIGQAMIFCHVSCLIAMRLTANQGSNLGSWCKCIEGIVF